MADEEIPATPIGPSESVVTEVRTPELQSLIESLEPAYAALEKDRFYSKKVYVVRRT